MLFTRQLSYPFQIDIPYIRLMSDAVAGSACLTAAGTVPVSDDASDARFTLWLV